VGVFRYRGRREGEPVLGRIEAASSEAVAGQLAALGIVPIEIEPLREGEDVLAALLARLQERKVSSEDLIVFTRQMNTMTRAGLPILRAIRAIAESTRSARLVEALGDVVADLESGRDLGASLSRHPDVFSNLFVNTVQMGEQTGRLEEAFAQLATYLEVDRDTRKRIQSATRYPMLVIGGIAIAIVVLNVFALPVFADIFEEFGAELPLPTRILMASSRFMRAWWYWLLGGGVGLAFGLRWWLRSERGRLVWSRRKLRLPVVGSILQRATFARFSRTFALSIASGIPLLQALRVSASVVDNAWLEAQLLELREGVERGDSITRSAAASGLFPSLVLQMMGIGEETGSLDELLHEVAVYYEGEVDYALKRLSEAIEPILIVAIGALVLLLALGVYLPMWDLAGAARG
jgi:MSHA biogenesis protein MshG